MLSESLSATSIFLFYHTELPPKADKCCSGIEN